MASMTACAGEKIVADAVNWRLKLKVFEAVAILTLRSAPANTFSKTWVTIRTGKPRAFAIFRTATT